jgi:DNA-binding protein H-NS
VLCDAGEHGWELVAILRNNIAYLKRAVQEDINEALQVAEHQETHHEVTPKYRDPATGETWSGRGRMATWLKKKQDAGEDIEKYRV